MRAALLLLSLSSVAAFGGGKVIAGCLDPTASNYNTPGPVTLEVPDMCIFYPAPPAPPMTPGRYGRGKGECCTNDYNCRSGQCSSSVGNGRFDPRCLGAGIWANPSGTGDTGTTNVTDGSRIMHPTCWAEATPEKLLLQLAACEIWDARPQTKGTPCEPTLDGMKGGPPNVGLGECDINLQNGNACFGSVGETCKEFKDCAQVVDERTPWGTDETPMQPVQLTCGRDLEAQAGVLRTPEDTARTTIVDVRCAFGDFSSACSLDPASLVDCRGFDAIPADTKPSGMCLTNCEALSACRCKVK